jgi:hypothetical protein
MPQGPLTRMALSVWWMALLVGVCFWEWFGWWGMALLAGLVGGVAYFVRWLFR